MNFEEFCEKIRNAASDFLGEEYEVSLASVRKNNNVNMKGLTIRYRESNLSPTLYLEQFYDRYKKGEDYQTIIHELIGHYEQHRSDDIDMNFFLDFEIMKSRIVFKLIGREHNEELLKEVPFVPWNDLAIVFCCLMMGEQFGSATILIREEHRKLWDVSVEELYECALANSPRLLPEEVKPMAEILAEILLGSGDCVDQEMLEAMKEELRQGDVPMYVLGNTTRIFGASVILYSDGIQKLADKLQHDLYVLPSSVHELIAVPAGDDMELDYIHQMVCEVNEGQVEPEDRLADSVYFYNRETKQISIARSAFCGD